MPLFQHSLISLVPYLSPSVSGHIALHCSNSVPDSVEETGELFKTTSGFRSEAKGGGGSTE